MDLNSPDLIEDMQPPPAVLYHYTNPKSFFDIVTSGPCLHATHHRFLNDVDEMRFGFKIALDVLEQLPGLDPEAKRLTVEKIKALLADDSYIACLSEKPNVLSQWRAYANNGAGYCVGIAAERRLDGYGDDEDFWSTRLLKCLYDRGTLENMLEERFARAISWHLSDSGKKYEDQDELLANDLSGIAWRYAHVSKHEHFLEEAEWRFVVGAPSRDVQYRIGAMGLTPYLPTDKLKISEVWIGPGVGPSPEVAKRTVTGFLERHGIIDAKVDCWESPYRR